MNFWTFLGIVMMICGALMIWSVTGAAEETRLTLGLVAGAGQIAVGIAWIAFRHRFSRPDQ